MNQWSHIEWLVDGEGEITIGRVGSIRCAAVASDGLKRRCVARAGSTEESSGCRTLTRQF